MCVARLPTIFRPGSWIAPTATVTLSPWFRQVAEKYCTGTALRARATKEVSRGLTLGFYSISPALANLLGTAGRNGWYRPLGLLIAGPDAPQCVISVDSAPTLSAQDLMYQNAEEFIADLRVIQDSLAQAGAFRIAYGPEVYLAGLNFASTW